MLKKWGNIFSGQCPLCYCSAPLGHFCQHCRQSIDTQQQYPLRCPFCRLALTTNTFCPNCNEHRLSLQNVLHIFDYVPPLDALILRFKNARQAHLATVFANHFYHQLKQLQKPLSISKESLIIPIPSSQRQLRKRNYNPAALFAKALTKKLQCRIDLTVLRRIESDYVQKSLHRHDRFLHSSQLYYAKHRLSFQHIILVDDILTTGSTLESAARALISAGATQVDAIVIARSSNPF